MYFRLNSDRINNNMFINSAEVEMFALGGTVTVLKRLLFEEGLSLEAVFFSCSLRLGVTAGGV